MIGFLQPFSSFFDNKKIEVSIVSLLCLFYTFNIAMPYFKFIFLFFISLYILITIFNLKTNSFLKLKLLVKSFFILLLVYSIFIITIFYSNKINLLILKDIINISVLFFIFFMMFYSLKNNNDVKLFKTYISYYIVILATIISILGLMSLWSSFSFLEMKEVFVDSQFIEEDRLDYNFALLPSFFAILVIYFNIKKCNFKFYFLNIILIINSLFILSSGSKRGLIIFTLVLFIISSFQIVFHFKQNVKLLNIYKLSNIYIITMLFVFLFFYLFFFQTSSYYKIKIFRFFGADNITFIQRNITSKIYRYYLIFNDSKLYLDLYNDIWQPKFDPKDPDSGWGVLNNEPIYPLKGFNVEIVPMDSKGLCLNSSIIGSNYMGKSYLYTKVIDFPVDEFDGVFFSIYCYATNDFNGTKIGIYSEGSSDRKSSYYNLTKKGVWQKIHFTAKCSKGIVPLYITIEKDNSVDFTDLNGHAIFAYPHFELLKDKFKFNPKEPESWGLDTNYTIYPLEGINVDIVPRGSIGFFLDSTVNVEHYENKAYSYLKALEIKLDQNQEVMFSVYCYATLDFNGSEVGIYAEGSSDRRKSIYDLKKKGIWQKLSFTSNCYKGIVPLYFTLEKNNALDFKELKGRVIFAHPQFSIINDISSSISNTSSSIFINQNDKKYNLNDSLSNVFFNINRIKDISHSYSSVKYSTLLCLESSMSEYFNSNCTIDSFVNYMSSLITVDSTYYELKTDFSIDSLKYDLGEDRILRWKFAIQIFKKEYNWKQKIFGDGFKFLNWYGYYFLGDKKATDYPHNPFLHILLYSGIVGVLLYILLLYKVFYYYIKYIKEYYLFFVFFLITYFFTFFSGGNPFDPPIMGFFMMLPFFIHYIHEKEKPEVEKQKFKVKIQGLVFKIKHFRNNS